MGYPAHPADRQEHTMSESDKAVLFVLIVALLSVLIGR